MKAFTPTTRRRAARASPPERRRGSSGRRDAAPVSACVPNPGALSRVMGLRARVPVRSGRIDASRPVRRVRSARAAVRGRARGRSQHRQEREDDANVRRAQTQPHSPRVSNARPRRTKRKRPGWSLATRAAVQAQSHRFEAPRPCGHLSRALVRAGSLSRGTTTLSPAGEVGKPPRCLQLQTSRDKSHRYFA